MPARMGSMSAAGGSMECDMPNIQNDVFNIKDTLGLSKGEGVAIYQIRRAVAQLKIVETSPMNVYQIRNVASSVLAQLRAYLESIDNAK